MPAVNIRVVEAKLTFVVSGTTSNSEAVQEVESVLEGILGKDHSAEKGNGYTVRVRPQANASSMTVSVR